MKKSLWVLIVMQFSFSAFAEESRESDYDIAFLDGGIYMQAKGFEDVIRTSYEVLLKLDKVQCKDLDDAKYYLISRIDANLSTLGSMIEDIEKGKVVSPRLYESQRKEKERMRKVFEETIGSEKANELFAKTKSDSNKFWMTLNKEREEKNWKMMQDNEKVKEIREKKIKLALDTLAIYGNIFELK